MQTGIWIVPGPLNHIGYKIKLPNGEIKEGPLRFTVSQRKRFDEYNKKKDTDKKHEEVAHIALNPVTDKENFSIEEILASLDLDQIALLNKMWMQNKIICPKITPEQDPSWF